MLYFENNKRTGKHSLLSQYYSTSQDLASLMHLFYNKSPLKIGLWVTLTNHLIHQMEAVSHRATNPTCRHWRDGENLLLLTHQDNNKSAAKKNEKWRSQNFHLPCWGLPSTDNTLLGWPKEDEQQILKLTIGLFLLQTGQPGLKVYNILFQTEGGLGGPRGYWAWLRIERSWFEPWPWTLCCVHGQDTSLSQCLSPPRCINGYWRI